MKTLSYDITVNNKISYVFDKMFASEEYEKWTKAFNSNSKMQGNMALGEEIFFHDADNSGMVAIVSEFIPNRAIKFTMVAEVMEGKRTVYKHLDFYEKYNFSQVDDGVLIQVELALPDEYEEMMASMWEKAVLLIQDTFNA